VNLPNALTGIVDESSQRFASFTYDAQGRAVETTYAGGANRYAVAYNTDGSRTVTDPANASRTFSLVTKSGIQKVAAVSGSPCAGCGLAASYTHDTAGNVTNRYDFNGVQTARQFSTDGRNLVTYEAEASGTPSARTTTTTWHTTYRLPTQIDESGKAHEFYVRYRAATF
jgi:YD repeat-containing protein